MTFGSNAFNLMSKHSFITFLKNEKVSVRKWLYSLPKIIEIIVQAIDPLEKSCGWISLSSLQVCYCHQRFKLERVLELSEL